MNDTSQQANTISDRKSDVTTATDRDSDTSTTGAFFPEGGEPLYGR